MTDVDLNSPEGRQVLAANVKTLIDLGWTERLIADHLGLHKRDVIALLKSQARTPPPKRMDGYDQESFNAALRFAIEAIRSVNVGTMRTGQDVATMAIAKIRSEMRRF